MALSTKIGAIVEIPFNTCVNGLPVAIAGSPVVSKYQDHATGVSTTGITLRANHNGRDGFHLLEIDTSTFNSTSTYTFLFTAGTVDGEPIANLIIGKLYCENGAFDYFANENLWEARDEIIGQLAVPIQTIDDNVDAILIQTTSLESRLPSDPADQSLLEAEFDATNTLVTTVDTVVDAIKLKTDNLPSDPADASVVAGLIAAVQAVVDLIKAKTDNLPSDPADQSLLEAEFDATNTLITTVDTVVDAIKLKTDNLPSDPADASVIAGLIAAVQAVVDLIKAKTDNLPSDPADQSLIEAEFDATNTLITTVDTVVDEIKLKTDNLPSDPADASDIDARFDDVDDVLAVFASMVEDTGTYWRFYATALELGPSGGGGGGDTDWTADERAAMRTIFGIPVSGTTPTDPTAGILDTIRDAVLTIIDTLPTNFNVLAIDGDGRVVSAVDELDSSVLDAIGATVFDELDTYGVVTVVELEVVEDIANAIKAKTDNLPSDPADQSLLEAEFDATNTLVTTVDTVVDAIAVVTAKVNTMLQTSGANYQYTVDALENAPSGSGGSGPVGPGADACTLTINDPTNPGAGIADADVWITADPNGNTTVAGTLQTNSNGRVTFMLDAGNTYYLWVQKDGRNSIRGLEFTAIAD